MNKSSHANIEQLLLIRDGHNSDLSEHVLQCKVCLAELTALEQLNSHLVTNADQEPEDHIWQRIVRTASNQDGLASNVQSLFPQHHDHGIDPAIVLNSQGSNNNTGSMSRAIYSLAASILVTGFIGLYLFSQNSNQVGVQNQLLLANIERLMVSSQSMEQVLAKVSLQSDLLDASQRVEAERLHWRLAYLDQMIQQHSTDRKVGVKATEVLWSDRVKALQELNSLYYQQDLLTTGSRI